MSHAETSPESAPALQCSEARRLMDALVEEGALKETERSLLFLHLKPCAACRAELDRRRALDARLLRAFRSVDTESRFAERVLAALPSGGDPDAPEWLKRPVARPRDELARALAESEEAQQRRLYPWARRLQTWGVFALVTILIGIGLLGAYFRHGITGTPSEAPCLVTRVEGLGDVEHYERKESLVVGEMLQKEHVISARSGPRHPRLSVRLESARKTIGDVHLKPGSKLRIFNRHHFELLKGEVYFEVRKDRPGAEAKEAFLVDTPMGTVECVGTVFGIRVPDGAASTVTVLVDDGVVSLHPRSGQVRSLRANEEADFLAGGLSPVRPADPDRFAWVRPGTGDVVVARPELEGAPAPAPAAPPLGVAVPRPFDGRQAVEGVDFRGLTLAQAWDRLGRHLENPLGVRAREDEARPPAFLTRPGTLLVRDALPAEAVLRWLARDFGLREDAAGQPWRSAEPDEELGRPVSGHWPEDLLERAQAPLPEAPGEPGMRTLNEFLGELTERSGINLWLDPRDAPEDARAWPRETERGASFLDVLRATLAAAKLEALPYDGLLSVASPDRIERLTTVPRVAPLAEWFGRAPSLEELRETAAWAEALRLLPDGRYGLGAEGAPVVRKAEAAGALRVVCGRGSYQRLEGALDAAREASAMVSPPAEALYADRMAGSVRDLSSLAELAARRGVKVSLALEDPGFPAQAFVNKSLPLGRTLEWAARAHGLGLRREGEELVVDAHAACYGAPAMQVVECAALARQRPEFAAEASRILAAQLRLGFPERFGKRRLYSLPGRLAFEGDLDDLAAAQRMARDLGVAVEAQPAGAPFNVHAWRPAWRAALDENLSEPFQGDGSGTLEGEFRALLRGGPFVRLRATILVDPASMERLAERKLGPIETKEKSLGEVLRAVAAAAGLRVALEDEVVWLRP
ncbi:MAG: FecR family protein [Planctomycetota bacterium]|nr:FecR family protein [Planctomycetota bacterium]